MKDRSMDDMNNKFKKGRVFSGWGFVWSTSESHGHIHADSLIGSLLFSWLIPRPLQRKKHKYCLKNKHKGMRSQEKEMLAFPLRAMGMKPYQGCFTKLRWKRCPSAMLVSLMLPSLSLSSLSASI